MGQEKRKFPRYTLSEENFNLGRFSSLLKSKKIVQMQICDLSKDGIGVMVAAHMKPEIGTKIGIEFTIPGGEQIACIGKVVRVSDLVSNLENGSLSHYRVGVQFENLPKSYQKLLDTHLKFALKNDQKKQNPGVSLQTQIENLGIKIKTTSQSIPYPLLILLLLTVCLYGFNLMVTKSQEVAKSKWWVKQAREFSSHMREQEIKKNKK